jgi:HAE1 family hydrophobic/amphiphilic exporter-1
MQKLAELCVRRPIFATVLILVLVVVGFAGFFQLGVDRYPNAEFPFVSISTVQPGASPRTIESEITDKIEQAVNTVSGIEELRSTSVEGVSIVTVQFVLEKNGDVAIQEVRDRVSRIISTLPQGIDAPVIEKYDAAALPVLSVVLSGKDTVRNLTEYADKTLRRRLESSSGVGRVEVLGGQKRQINVWVDAYALRSQGMTVTDVTRALQAQNSEIPAGRLDQNETEQTLRVEGRIQSVKDFDNIRLGASTHGGIVRLADVARIEDGSQDAASAAELNGQRTITLQIVKQSGQNTVQVVHGLKERLEELKPELQRRGYQALVVQDESEAIEASVHSVQEHLIVGSILAVLVVLFFLLNWRSAFIAAVAVPASIISTFGLMWAMGFTLNTLTLLALTLAVGIVIDDAIVVLENIYRFIEEKGLSPFQAAIEATREIGLAVMATTLSLIAVFMPVAFMAGIVGRYLYAFGMTMAFAIMVSLLVAFSLTPTMSARLLHAHEPEPAHPSLLHRLSNSVTRPITRFLEAIDNIYFAILKWSMGHRWVIVVACILALVSVPFIGGQLRGGFFPDNDDSQFQITLRAPEGTSLQQTMSLAHDAAERLRKRPEVKYTLVSAGAGAGGEDPARNQARILVRLTPVTTRKATQEELLTFARDEVMPHFKNRKLRITVSKVSEFGGGGDVQLAITGSDLTTLGKLSDRLVSRLRAMQGVAEAESNLHTGKPELVARVDRDMAAALGVQPGDVAAALNYLVGEREVSRYEENGEQYEVHVRASKQFRTDEEGLQLLPIPASPPQSSTDPATSTAAAGTAAATTAYVPLGQVVKFVPSQASSSIARLNRQRQVTLSAYLRPGGDAAKVQAALGRELELAKKEMNLGADYQSLAVGESKEQAKAFSAFLTAFGLSLIFMYLILAAQFEHWLHPITILMSLPLTIPFALLSLLLFGQSVNLFSMLGILVLFGVVKKNAILQIDHTIQLRERGMPRNEAILQANRDRLRPILMTTIAFVAGMSPLLLSTGVGAGDNHAIGTVIFGGQTFSLLLTLLATPVAYSLFDDFSAWWARIRHRLTGRISTAAAGDPTQRTYPNPD